MKNNLSDDLASARNTLMKLSMILATGIAAITIAEMTLKTISQQK